MHINKHTDKHGDWYSGQICVGKGWVITGEIQLCMTTPGIALIGCEPFRMKQFEREITIL